MSITFRTPGPWGGGIGANLTPNQVDYNFYTLWTLYLAVQAQVPTAEIDYFSIVGSSLYVHLTDHTVLGPYTLPTWQPVPVGEWQPATQFYVSDELWYNGAAYLVLVQHVSQATFNPGYQIGGQNVYSQPIIVCPGSVLPLGGQEGQVLTVIHAGGSELPTMGWQYQYPSGGMADQVLTLVVPGTSITPPVVAWSTSAAGLTPAGGNLTWYVNPSTGNDSNVGSSGSPFKTIQYALGVAAGYNWGGLYAPTINLADGIYDNANQAWSVSGGIAFPTLIDLGGFATLVGDIGAPSAVVLDFSDGSGSILFYSGLTAVGVTGWNISGFHARTNGAGGALFNLQPGCQVSVIAAIEIELVSGAGDGASVFLINAASFSNFSTITFSGAAAAGDFNFMQVSGFAPAAGANFNGGTLVFSTAITFTQLVLASDYAGVILNTASITNPSNATFTNPYLVGGYSSITSDVDPSSFFSGTPGFVDGTSSWQNNTFMPTGAISPVNFPVAIMIHGLPTTGDLQQSCWGVFKDLGSDVVYVAYNDGGTIKKAALL